MTTDEALAILRAADHSFLTSEGTDKISAAFGVRALQQTRTVAAAALKGLRAWDDDGNELPDGSQVSGCDAADLAEHICTQLGLPFLRMYGRGSRLRSACDALAHHEPNSAHDTDLRAAGHGRTLGVGSSELGEPA